MRFSILSTVAVAALSRLGFTAARSDADDIVISLQTLADKCDEVIPSANQLNFVTALLFPINTGPWATVLQTFDTISNDADVLFKFMDDRGLLAADFAGHDALNITKAFHTYTIAQTELLGIVTNAGGQGLLSPVPIVGEEATIKLVKAKGVIVSLASGLFTSLSDSAAGYYKGKITEDGDLVQVAFEMAIKAYS